MPTTTPSPSISSPAATLESVQAQLTLWRSTYGKGNKIPTALWETVRSLIPHYPIKHLATALKVHPHRLRAKMDDTKRRPSAASPFVEVAFAGGLPSLPPQAISYTGTLEFIRPDGTTLKATGLENKTLFTLAQQFMRG